MSRFSGRRPTGLGKALLEGLGTLATAMADAPKLDRINNIDIEIMELQQERDHLIKSLTEPIAGLEVSENYNPNWTKSTSPVSDAPGRLTECGGSYDSRDVFNDCHPGCPYKGTKHNPHEFTLRD